MKKIAGCIILLSVLLLLLQCGQSPKTMTLKKKTVDVSAIRAVKFDLPGCQVDLWPGLMDSGMIQLKSAALPLDEEISGITTMEQRARSERKALRCSQIASIAYYNYLVELQRQSEPLLNEESSKKLSLEKPYEFNLKGGYIAQERFDSKNNCELLYRIPLKGISGSIDQVNSSMDNDSAVELTERVAMSGSLNPLDLDHSYKKEEWINDTTLQVRSFGIAGLKGQQAATIRQNLARRAALVIAQSRILQIIDGVLLTGVSSQSKADSGGRIQSDIIKTVYDEDNNCEITVRHTITPATK